MTGILFICHGNICRSPMAEMILRKLVQDAGREAEFVIESCATSAEEIGHDVYPPARRMLEAHGVPCPSRAARRLTAADYERFDRLICMEQYNLRNALRLLGGDPEHKLSLLLRDRDVDDPWYSGDFDTAYRDIEEGCRRLL